ncbi:MAG: hypothetical protein QM786_19785 [Breznakibacter sp.]
MFRKVVLIVVSLLLLVTVVFIAIRFQNLKQFDPNQALKAVSPNAAAVILSHRIPATLQAMADADSLLKDLEWTALISDLKSQIEFFRSLPFTDPGGEELFSDRPCAISILPNGDSLAYTYYFAFFDVASQKKFSKWMKSVGEKDGSDMYILKPARSASPFFSGIKDGVLVVSRQKENVSEAFVQLRNGSGILSDPEFVAVERTVSKESTASLFINLEQFTSVLSGTLDPAKYQVDFKKFGNWAALDIDLKSRSMGIAGLISIGKTDENVFGSLFAQIEPTPSNLMNSLPSGTVMASCFNFGSDRTLIKQNVARYISKLGYRPLNDSIGALFYGAVCLADISNKGSVDRILTLGTEGQSKAMEQIKDFLYGSLIDPLIPDTHYEPNENVKIPIYKNLADSMLSGSLGFLFKQVPDKYFSFFENQIVFADSVAPITRFLYQRILDKTLLNNPLYKSFSSTFPTNSHFNFFVSPKYLPTLLTHKLKPKAQNILHGSAGKLANFYGFGLQLTLTDNNILVSNNLFYTPNYKQDPVTVWQSKLDTSMLMKPLLVFNPKTRQRDMLVQDLSNKIYLISSLGVISWVRKIDARIIGEIQFIDFYKNGKTQFAFTAGDKIHVIDFNGNNVGSFPVQLPCNATNPLAVFDYEKDNNLRFVVACSDKSVRVFDKQGNRLPDWKFPGSETEVSLPVQHFRIGDKDFIVVTDNNRFYFLDRKGGERTSVGSIPPPISPLAMISENGTFISMSAKGQLLTINLSGKRTSQTNTQLVPHGMCTVKPFENAKKTMLYGDENSIALVTQDGSVVWQKKFDEGLTSMPDIYAFPNGQRKVGVTTKSNQICLFNADGSLFPGFPMVGMSRFSIGYMNNNAENFNLIVGGKDLFLYNYEIQIQ